jgi:uncharacterized protein YktA (UPF0223 family)
MKKYPKNIDILPEELGAAFFTKFKIVVPTEKDEKEIMDAFEYLHNRNMDQRYVTVCQLLHEYGDHVTNIVVDKQLYDKCKGGVR